TPRPSNSPPARRRASSKDSRVVLPDFHWLVSRVRLPGASKPCHSQGTDPAAAALRSADHSSRGKVENRGNRAESSAGFMASPRLGFHCVALRCVARDTLQHPPPRDATQGNVLLAIIIVRMYT